MPMQAPTITYISEAFAVVNEMVGDEDRFFDKTHEQTRQALAGVITAAMDDAVRDHLDDLPPVWTRIAGTAPIRAPS